MKTVTLGSFRLILQVKCFNKMSKSQILKYKTFVTRDMAIQWIKILETFFFHATWGVAWKKKVSRIFIHWIAVSRVTNVLAERNSFHSVIQLQGSVGAEHPTPCLTQKFSRAFGAREVHKSFAKNIARFYQARFSALHDERWCFTKSIT